MEAYSYRLYYNFSFEYFKGKHLICAILAVAFLFIFTVLPVVMLILYPFKFFQQFLSLFPNNWHFLHVLWTISRVPTRMVLNLEHLTVAGLLSLALSFNLHS